MKKKIINGILMVALVAATSTSFVSCKDTSEDVKTDLMAQVNAVKANLEPRVEKAEKDIQNLNDSITSHRTELNGLRADVNDLKTRVKNLEDDVDSLEDVTKKLEYRMDTVENRIATIVDALRKMVTSVNVNATKTSLLQNSKLFPGINAQFLGAAYGQAVNPGTFPSTDADDYIAGHGVVLTKNDIKGDVITWKKNAYLPIEESAAGTLYFTINPSNIDATDAESLKLSLVNSQNAASFVELGKVEQDTETELEWGLTRADGDNFQPKLWKSEATIDFAKAETLKKVIDPAKQIDFKAIKDQVRTLFTNVYHSAQDVNRNNYKETTTTATKTLIKDAAGLVATVLQTEFPGLPALALKAEWKDTVGTRSVLSDYSIAATAYKPLSFSFGSELGIQGRQFSLDKIDAVIARIIDKVKAKVNAVGGKVNNIGDINITFGDISGFNKDVYVVLHYTTNVLDNITIQTSAPATGTDITNGAVPAAPGTGNYYTKGAIDMTTEIGNLQTQLQNGIPVAALNEMIAEVKKVITDVNSYADRTKNFEVRVSNYLESLINRVITKISADGLTRVLEPVMLYQGSNGVARVATGATFKAGEYDLIPTTMTYEVLAPVYKKYVAIIGKDGKAREAVIKTNGEKNFKKFTVSLEAGDQAIVYDALDFSGKQIAKKYAINVVK